MNYLKIPRQPAAFSSLSSNCIGGEGRGEVVLGFRDQEICPQPQRGDIFVENQTQKSFQAL